MADHAKIALGAVAAAGIVVVTYLLLKGLGPQRKKPKKDAAKQNQASGDASEIKQKETEDLSNTSEVKSSAAEATTPTKESANLDGAAASSVAVADTTKEHTDVDVKKDKDSTASADIVADTIKEDIQSAIKEELCSSTSAAVVEAPPAIKEELCSVTSAAVVEAPPAIKEELCSATSAAVVEAPVVNVTQPETLAEAVKETEIQTENDLGLSNGKKTEHSSDESSYDVIENEAANDIAKTDDIKDDIVTEDIPTEGQEQAAESKDDEPHEKSEEQSDQGSFLDATETSMVVVDESIYASAEEGPDVAVSNQSEELQTDKGEDTGVEGQPESTEEQPESTSNESCVGDNTLSNSVADQSVVFVGEDKPKEVLDDSVIFMSEEKPEEKLEDSVVIMGEEKPEDKEMAASIDLSSWQKTEDISGEGNNGEMGASWTEVTEETVQDEEEEVVETVKTEVIAVVPIKEEIAAPESPAQQAEMPSAERTTEVISLCQSDPATVSREDLVVLAAILSQGSSHPLKATVLDCLVRVSAFSQHNANIRDCGLPDLITSLTMESCQEVVQAEAGSEVSLAQLCQVVTNFSLDPKTQAKMEAVVPVLVNVACQESVSESLLLSLIQPLTNFSSSAAHLHHFHRLVQPLLSLLQSGGAATQVKALKVLVNLSLDADMLPHLLAAKAPTNLLDLLDLPSSNDVILRAVTFLANVEESLHSSPRAPLALPVEEKAESPLTMHVALLGVEGAPQLRNKVFRLTRHDDEDVVFQASRLYKVITSPPK